MVVFDVDGTLIGGEPTDWACFDKACMEVTGRTMDRESFATLSEVTAQAIIDRLLADLPPHERKAQERGVAARYVELLKDACRADPSTFTAAKGATELLLDLRRRGIPVAIATGDWRESILVKLGTAGIPVDGIPISTSSDHYSRADIIAGAVALAGRSLGEAIYVGDGPWDYRATRKLGIPFVGVGHRRKLLEKEGARHLMDDMSPGEFWRVRAAMGAAKPPFMQGLSLESVVDEARTASPDGHHFVSTAKALIDLDSVCALLAISYWAKDRPRAVIEASLRASICFGLYERASGRQVGFARIVSDNCTFSWLCDVAVDEGERGKGLGKFLMACVMAHPVVARTRVVLGTRDAHGLYEKYGFVRHELMRRNTPGTPPSTPPGSVPR
jgi:phosphoglycolate phosphatase-like HAD superfamily hydrolase/GNAT superfamily N-acetyltransferase